MVRKIKKRFSNVSPVLLKMAEDEYVINFGEDTSFILERYYEGLDLLANDSLEEAEIIFKDLVDDVRAYYDSIVALINIFTEKRDFPNISKIFNIGVKDLKLILNQLPSGGKLLFTYSANKGFLKFIYKLGIRHLNTSRVNDAIGNFNLLLKLNPTDEFDVNEVLIQSLFEKEDYETILALTENIDNNKNPSTIFNRILALIKINETSKAKELIKNLNDENLKIYGDLDPSKDYAMDISEYISFSVVDDKSKFYWNNFFRYWTYDSSSLEFLDKNIKKTCLLPCSSDFFLEPFESHLEDQDLKEFTVKNHIENIEIFEDILDDSSKIVDKLKSLLPTTNKIVLNKIIISLNKYYSFAITDKQLCRKLKDSLKEFKETYLN